MNETNEQARNLVLAKIDWLELNGDSDRIEDGSARLARPVQIGDVRGSAMVWYDSEFVLILFIKPVSGSKTKSEYRWVLVDSFGAFGKRGQVYADITQNGVRKAVPGVKKYVQASADLMTMRVDKRFVARDYGNSSYAAPYTSPDHAEPAYRQGDTGASRYGDL